MVGKSINLSYLVVGLHGLKIFEIRFGEKVHIVQGSNVNSFLSISKIIVLFHNSQQLICQINCMTFVSEERQVI